MRLRSDGALTSRAAAFVVPLASDRRGYDLRIATILKLAIGLLLVGNLGRIPLFSTGGRDVPVLITDLVVAAVIGAGAIAMASHRTMRIDAVAAFALVFAAVGGLSAVLAIPRFDLSTFAVIVSLSYLARWLFYFAIYVVAINTLRAGDVEGVWSALEWTILLFSLFGILQSAFLPGFAQLVYPDSRLYLDWDPQGRRLVSTFLDPNFAGGFIGLGLVATLARVSTGTRVAGWKLFVLAVALLLTASRGSIVAVIAGCGVILLLSGLSKRVIRAIGAAMVLVLLALPQLIRFAASFNKLTIDRSALARLTSWLHGWTVLKDHWVLGIGFNTWGYVSEQYGWIRSYAATYAIDGGLLFVVVMTGVVGLALYLAMLWSVVRTARRVWRDREMSPAMRGLAVAAAASIPTIVVHSLFTNSLMQPFLMEALWVMWALPFVALKKS
jgi:hypothetical protein